jgi:hypothetical protein
MLEREDLNLNPLSHDPQKIPLDFRVVAAAMPLSGRPVDMGRMRKAFAPFLRAGLNEATRTAMVSERGAARLAH